VSERLNIVTRLTGAKTVQKDIANIGSAALRTGGSINFLNKSLRGIGAFFIIRQLVKTADTFTLITNRLAVATKTTGELVAVTEELLKVSRETRTSFEANAELFQRFRAATDGLGLSNKRLLKIINSINQAVTISGVTSVEASQALRQLSQGIGSSELRGQELRSVLEQLPKVADVIAARFGVARAALLRLGQDGKIGAKEVIEAFEDAAESLSKTFALVTPTIGQSFTVLRNEFINFVGQLNKSSGAFTAISKAILFLADNFDILGRVISAVSLVIGTVYAKKAIGAAISATQKFTLALLKNPFTAILVVGLAVIAFLISFASKMKVAKDSTATLATVAKVSFEIIGEVFQKFVDLIAPAFEGISAVFKKVFGDLNGDFEGFALGFARVIDTVIGIFNGLARVAILAAKKILEAFGTNFNEIGRVIKLIFIAITSAFKIVVNGIITGLNKIIDGASVVVKAITGIVIPRLAEFGQKVGIDIPLIIATGFEGLGNIGQQFIDEFNMGLAEGGGVEDAMMRLFIRVKAAAEMGVEAAELDEVARTASADLTREFDIEEVLIALDAQAALLRKSAAARDLESNFIKIANALLKKNIDIRKEEFAEIAASIKLKLQDIALLEEQADLIDDTVGKQEALARALGVADAAFLAGFISLDQYTTRVRELNQALTQTEQSITAGFDRAFLKLADSATNFADITENLLTSAFGAAEDAFVEFVKTGEFNFSKLVDSILEDLARLAFQQAIFGILAGGGAGGGFGAGQAAGTVGQFLLGRQAGGPVSRGVPTIVGERGPEVFMPTSAGNIIPGAAAAPEVNVRVVNITDPEEIAAALSGPAGEQAIINVLRRNRRTVRTVIGT